MKVCITGGTGSLGSSLAERWILNPEIERIVILSRDEFKQRELSDRLPKAPEKLRLFLGDVRDRDRLKQVFWGCDTIIHAAALKRIDEVANSPWEVLKTNTWGTQNVIEAALEAGVAKVLLISSDKAVEPTNAYGVSKAAAEQIAVTANIYTYPRGTRVSVVRYGNVLGSRGSVIHIWRKQAVAGGPLLLTHPEMTRFWITLPQAHELIERCLKIMGGGEIFVPLLKAFMLGDLAELIGGGKDIKIVGLRPGGEKIHEVLISQEELGRTHFIGNDCDLVSIHPSWKSWAGILPGTRDERIESFAVRSSEAELLRDSEMLRMLEYI